MNWSIPAKTFLVGEYAAIEGGPAVLLNTQPCFELSLTPEVGLQGIHPESPAGRWWLQQNIQDAGLLWRDPYDGCGGLGASSAQFVACYFATQFIKQERFDFNALLDAYFQMAWNGKGAKPSGYDVLAQSLSGCVFIEKAKNSCQLFTWPFERAAFLLLHTQQKLATHVHLQHFSKTIAFSVLNKIVEDVFTAFVNVDEAALFAGVKAYYQALKSMDLVAAHTQAHIEAFENNPDILAAKGCGALGADVLFVIVRPEKLEYMAQHFSQQGLRLLATSQDLYRNLVISENNMGKRLEISRLSGIISASSGR